MRVNNTGFTTDASGAPYLYSVDFGGSQTLRTWKLFSVNSGFGGLTLGPNASIWLPNHPRRPLAWGLGDSYMYGTNATHISMAGFNSMCDLLGLEPMPDGIGGSGWLSTGSNAPATRISQKLATLTRTPDYVFFDLGYNDAGGNMTTLAANFDAAVAAVQSAVPSAKIIVFGPATPTGTQANLTTVKTTVQGRCTALGLTFVDVDNWVSNNNKSLYTAGDNVHPTQVGYDYIATRRGLTKALIRCLAAKSAVRAVSCSSPPTRAVSRRRCWRRR